MVDATSELLFRRLDPPDKKEEAEPMTKKFTAKLVLKETTAKPRS